jgi:hypothetical protein
MEQTGCRLPSAGVAIGCAAVLAMAAAAFGETHKITATVAGGNGTVEPSGTVTVEAGRDVTFRFTPEPGYAFTDVRVDGKRKPYAWSTVTFKKVSADHTLSVAFRRSRTTGFKTRGMLELWERGGRVPANTISPDDLVYCGAFRLPRGGKVPACWGYGGSALAYYEGGDPDGPNDGYPGSLFGTGHPYGVMISEVAIPEPVISKTKDLKALNTARTFQPFAKVDKDLTGGDGKPSKLGIRGLEYLPAQADEQKGRLYFGKATHFAGRTIRPNHGWCEIDLARHNSAGLWKIGGLTDMRSGSYLFEIPRAWADKHVGGRTLATGRSRWGQGCGDGPHLYAIAPWQDGRDGKPPAPGARLKHATLLDYAKAPIRGFRITDGWNGGAWLQDGDKAAVALNASLGYGCIWYDHAMFSDHRVTALQFFDPADLAAVAGDRKAPHEPQPYATLDVSERMYTYDAKTSKSRALVGMAYDRKRGVLYVQEARGDGDRPLVHVWRLRMTGRAAGAKQEGG